MLPAVNARIENSETWNIGSGTVEQGGTLTVELSGLTPGQTVSATLYSDPIVVDAIPAANAQGEITFIVGIPADFDTTLNLLAGEWTVT